jgi:hypothetical protein
MKIQFFYFIFAAYTLAYNNDVWQRPPSVSSLPITCRSPQSKQGDAIVPYVIRKVPLGNADYYAKVGNHPNTFVKFSPDNTLLVIGTMMGHIMVVEVYTNKTLWDKKVAEGMVKRIDFSPDGKRIYFGEQSVDGFIYSAETYTGKILWKFRLADNLQQGSPLNKNDAQDIYDKPGCYQLKVLNNGDVIVLGIHSWGDWRDRNKCVCLSQIYRLSSEGKIIWSFPADKPIYYTVVFMDCDMDGKKSRS